MKTTIGAAAMAAALAAVSGAASAQVFNRIASFPVSGNLPDGMAADTETAPEIITATEDGMTLVYSDSPLEAIGMIDISDPANPQPMGAAMLGGEPTSVTTRGGKAFATVNTSESFTNPSGRIEIVDMASGAVEESCDLGGQPDSSVIAHDGSFLAVAIENERDEDLGDGGLPQLPGGGVAIIPMGADASLDCDGMIMADLAGVADVAPEDPEPEFVDVNAAGEIAVTLQENNHIVVLDSAGEVISDFSAGAVDLTMVDVGEEGALLFDSFLGDVPREPDAVQWLDDERLVTANEGDWKGGSRGFTIFSKAGEVLYESGAAPDHILARHGHYPEERSGNKGGEPEGMEIAEFEPGAMIFLLSERGSAIFVYRDTGGAPDFVQLLPSGIGPEGAVAIPSRGLMVTANEEDLGPDGGVRAHVMIYELQEGAPDYPTLVSQTLPDGRPIGWGAISGMVGDAEEPGILYAVNDSFYGMQPTIFRIDATQSPATITDAIRVTREGAPAQKLDLEGIALDGEGGFFLASEGRPGRMIPHGIYHVNGEGEIEAEIAWPKALRAVARRWASEGITRVGSTLWIAIQREFDDDPAGLVKLLSYDLETEEWGVVHYPKEPTETGWIGLSEITAHDGFLYVIERDNQIGQAARVKRLYRVALEGLAPVALGEEPPVVEKEMVRDLLPDLMRWNGFAVDKIEGFAVDAAGEAFVSTDNDGVDDSSGETHFWSIGEL